MSFKFELGVEAKDKVTGFKGIILSRTEWLNGCKRYALQSRKLDAGKVIEVQYFDEEQIEIIGNGIAVRQRPTGGDRPAPMRALDPPRR